MLVLEMAFFSALERGKILSQTAMRASGCFAATISRIEAQSAPGDASAAYQASEANGTWATSVWF